MPERINCLKKTGIFSVILLFFLAIPFWKGAAWAETHTVGILNALSPKDKNKKRAILVVLFLSCLLLILNGGCGSREKPFTVGICLHTAVHIPIMTGFKEGMAEFGYVEGKNISYIYNGITENDPGHLDAEIKKLLSEGADLLLTMGSPVSLRAEKAVEGTDIPIIFCASVKPVEYDLVESLSHPGGKMTGVQVAETTDKLMELLTIIRPGTKKIFMPYNPDDKIPSFNKEFLNKTAAQLGIDLVSHEVHSVEEAIAAIKALPKEGTAIYRVPSPTLDDRNEELSQAAIDRRIPMGSVFPLDRSVLIVLSSDFFDTGRQAARMAHLVRLGAKPGDLPVETSDAVLTVNLQTAEKIGVDIPKDILLQANRIIR